MAFEMVLGWFGISTVWLLPLVWRYVTRALAGERDFLKGRGTVRLWLVTLVALSASAALEALTSGADPQDKAGGAAGRALSSLFSHMLGWTGAFLLMLGVLIWVAPMVRAIVGPGVQPPPQCTYRDVCRARNPPRRTR
jgi:DNA segregation ATPase FtsK/SpoIIIE, S-DNA-T family